MSEPKWRVGQEVLIYNVNRNNGKTGVSGRVTKVGRTLFYVARDGQLVSESFRQDSGRSNDSCGHTFVRTLGEARDLESRTQAVESLRQHGIEFRIGKGDGRFTTAQLVDLASLVESFEEDR